MSEKTLLIGIDCAAQTSTLGLARAEFSMGEIVVTEVHSMKYTSDIDDTVSKWIEGRDATGVLLALDSPLGWPATMGPVLSGHDAGGPTHPSDTTLPADKIGDVANHLFRRRTDHVVQQHLKDAALTSRPPFDIGADKIARVAHASLCLLARLRVERKLDLPLAWIPGTVDGVQVIEVYPAATLRVHQDHHDEKLMVTGYKKTKALREEMFAEIKKVFGSGRNGLSLRFKDGTDERAAKTDHALDAVICCLAAADFLTGEVISPKSVSERTLAEKEGWIWVRATQRQKARKSAERAMSR